MEVQLILTLAYDISKAYSDYYLMNNSHIL